MTEMTSRERVLKLFNREPIDTMPCFSGQGMVTVPAIEALGIKFPQIHLTAENMAGSAVKSAMSHRRTVLSELPEASQRPSGL